MNEDILSCVLSYETLLHCLPHAAVSGAWARAVGRVRERALQRSESATTRAIAAHGLARKAVIGEEDLFKAAKRYTMVGAGVASWRKNARNVFLSCPPETTVDVFGRVELRGHCVLRGCRIRGNIVVASGADVVLVNCTIADTEGVRVATRGSLAMVDCSVELRPLLTNHFRAVQLGADSALHCEGCDFRCNSTTCVWARHAKRVVLLRTRVFDASEAISVLEGCGELTVADLTVRRSVRALHIIRCVPTRCSIDGVDVRDCCGALFVNYGAGTVDVTRLAYSRMAPDDARAYARFAYHMRQDEFEAYHGVDVRVTLKPGFNVASIGRLRGENGSRVTVRDAEGGAVSRGRDAGD